jgi:hypothetical protein
MADTKLPDLCLHRESASAVAARADIDALRKSAEVLERLLRERMDLLQALRPFAEAALELQPSILYRPGRNGFCESCDPTVVLIGRKKLTGYFFARALDQYLELTKVSEKPEAANG